MRIRNTTTKAIGFGTVSVMPGVTGDTPRGFDKGHPVVDYYLSRGWIEEIGAENGGTKAAADAGNTAGADTKPGGGDAGAKPVERMNKEELTALAVEMGLEVAESDTKQAILDSVRAVRQANA